MLTRSRHAIPLFVSAIKYYYDKTRGEERVSQNDKGFRGAIKSCVTWNVAPALSCKQRQQQISFISRFPEWERGRIFSRTLKMQSRTCKAVVDLHLWDTVRERTRLRGGRGATIVEIVSPEKNTNCASKIIYVNSTVYAHTFSSAYADRKPSIHMRVLSVVPLEKKKASIPHSAQNNNTCVCATLKSVRLGMRLCCDREPFDRLALNERVISIGHPEDDFG